MRERERERWRQEKEGEERDEKRDKGGRREGWEVMDEEVER